MKNVALAALALLLLVSSPASAIVLDFGSGQGGAGGTIVVNGSDVQGIGILIDALTVLDNGSSAVYDVDGVACGGLDGSCGQLDFDSVAGTISITGEVPLLLVGPTTLMTGLLDSVDLDAIGGGFPLILATLRGTDNKAPELLAALGINPSTTFQFAGFTIGSFPIQCMEGATCYTAFSTDIANASVGAIPEPGTLMLLGGGLLGLARIARRRG
jgi:hypothetical protein